MRTYAVLVYLVDNLLTCSHHLRRTKVRDQVTFSDYVLYSISPKNRQLSSTGLWFSKKKPAHRLSRHRFLSLTVINHNENRSFRKKLTSTQDSSTTTVPTMRLVLEALITAAALVGGSATTTDLELLRALPSDSSSENGPLTEGPGNVFPKTALRGKSARPTAVDSSSFDSEEERGFFSKFSALQDLVTVKESFMKKVVTDKEKLEKAFKYLAKKKIDPRTAYLRLMAHPDYPDLPKFTEVFLKRYGKWADDNLHLFPQRPIT